MGVSTLTDQAKSLLPRLLELRERKDSPIVLIDGHAGSGKSTFADALKNLIFVETRQQPKLIHMDDLYPGWEGLRAGSIYLHDRILKPVSHGKSASWQNWSWVRSERLGFHEFDGENLLIAEGCGAISANNAALADLTIWIDSDSETRKKRFMERDGGRFRDRYALWAAQESEFYLEESSRALSEVQIQN